MDKRTLYHFSLSPFSRKVRIVLHEKGLQFELKEEKYWQRRREFLAMNPAAQVPVLVDGDNSYAESTAICEYLEEAYPEPALLPGDIKERAEVRRISGWFNNKFYYEVTKHILDEKVMTFLKNAGEPNSNIIRIGKSNMHYHLDYISYLFERRDWLAGNSFTLADITAASQLSVLDYLGDVPWEHYPSVKQWYMLIKSRPSFRNLLGDSLQGFNPPVYYANLDF